MHNILKRFLKPLEKTIYHGEKQIQIGQTNIDLSTNDSLLYKIVIKNIKVKEIKSKNT